MIDKYLKIITDLKSDLKFLNKSKHSYDVSLVHVRFCKMSESYLKEKSHNGDNIKDYPRSVCTLVDKWRRYSLRKRTCSHHNYRIIRKGH